MKATDLQIGKVYRVYKEFKLTRKPTIDRRYIFDSMCLEGNETGYIFIREDNSPEAEGVEILTLCSDRVKSLIRFVKDYDYLKNHAGLNSYSLNLLDKAENGKRQLSKSDLAGFILKYNVHDWLSREHTDIKRDEYINRFNSIYGTNFK